MNFPILSLYVFAPVLGMAAIFCIPSKRGDIIKTVAAAAAAIPLMIGVYLFTAFRDDGLIHYYESIPWISGLNVYYKLGMDGISAPMIVLSGLVGFLAVVASWGIEKQVKGYFALILMLLAGMNGVFCTLDFFLFYVFWEVMLLPMYFLIGIWGGPNRVYAAIKFFLYTMAGSVLMLVVLLATWYWSDGNYLAQSRPDLVGQAKAAVFDRQIPVLKEIEKAEKAGAVKNEQLASLFAAARLDGSANKDLRSYVNDLKKVNVDQFVAARTATEEAKARLVRAKEAAREADNADKRTAAQQEISAAEQDIAAKSTKMGEILKPITLERTFDFLQLKARYSLFMNTFVIFGAEVGFATLMFVFLYIAFAIKVPVFPFHTWLPWAHVEAPTAISVILAGILLKMGVYGFFRIAYPLFPTAAVGFAVPIALLGVFNIIYGACCALAQDDLKKIVAYSSVSHMGYCMLGIAALTGWGMTGSVLQMFNHGTSTSMMFLLVGVIYDRAHHRDVNKFGGLAAVLPVYTGIMTIALFASMGLPGLSGFISEILVFLGAFRSELGQHSMVNLSFQSMTIVAAIGVVLTAAYLLWMMQRVFFGPLNEKYKKYSDLTGREMFSLIPLVFVVLLFGIWPQPLINLTKTSIEQTQSHVLTAAGVEMPPAAAAKAVQNDEKAPALEAAKPAKHDEKAGDNSKTPDQTTTKVSIREADQRQAVR